MAVDREAIYVALAAKLSAIEGVKKLHRRYLDFEQVPEQPCILLVGGEQVANAQRGLPTIWTINATVVVYAKASSDPNAPPGSVLNPLLTAIEEALEPLPGMEANTLGGACVNAVIAGTVEVYEGAAKEVQLVALVPVEITATA